MKKVDLKHRYKVEKSRSFWFEKYYRKVGHKVERKLSKKRRAVDKIVVLNHRQIIEKSRSSWFEKY